MWKEIKKTISSNNSNHIFPTAITVDNEVITNPCDIVNAFNNYLLMHSINNLFFLDYFPPLNIESLFVTPTNGTKVSNIESYSSIEKGSTLECLNYRPIFLLSNINKILKDLCITDFITF